MRPVAARLLTAVLMIVMILCSAFLCPRNAFSYTAEQKRAAKAWLSSHGYPPTEDGAWQAYSDWLDGQWWDEFGSPEEYFNGEDEEDGDEEEEDRPTAATQQADPDQQNTGDAQGNGGQRSDAETLTGVMSGENGEEESTEETETETTEEETETTEITAEEELPLVPVEESSEEEPTAATQADIMDLVDATEEKDSDRVKENLPFAIGGLAVVALLLGLVIYFDRRK